MQIYEVSITEECNQQGDCAIETKQFSIQNSEFKSSRSDE